MKKLFALICLTVIAAAVNAQVTFKNGIKPNTVYTTNREMTMAMTMAPPEALASMAAGQGIKMDMVFNTTSIISTSAKNSSGQIPLQFNTKVGTNTIKMNGQAMPSNVIPKDDADMTMFGRYDGGKIMVDSIPGKAMNDSLKQMTNQIIEAARNSAKFPDHPLKVGDSFTSDSPFALPLPGMSQKPMDIKATYKLVSLNGSVGVFELSITMSVNMNQAAQGQQIGVTVSGLGTGTMTFDARQEYYTAMDLKMLMDFGVSSGGMDIKGKGNISVNDKVDIASK